MKKKKVIYKTKKIRKGDTVMAITGNDKGQVGTVLSCNGDRALVQGLNMRKKHVKRSEANPQGGVVDFERPLHVSNLRVCVEGDKPVKLRLNKDKELFYVEKGKEVVYRSIKKPAK